MNDLLTALAIIGAILGIGGLGSAILFVIVSSAFGDSDEYL